MTIKIEREALECITNDALHRTNTTLATAVELLKGLDSDGDSDSTSPTSISDDTDSYPELEAASDDDSTVSSYSSSSTTSGNRVVSWADELVSEVRVRERTRLEDVRGYYYSYEETQR